MSTWTSDVNKPIFGNDTSLKTQEQVFKQHIWNLYSSLKESGWVAVSASCWNGSNYILTQNSWSSGESIQFPSRMTYNDITYDQIINNPSLVDNYIPSEHSWATLKKQFLDGDYYITLDCRYPLPPHKPNTNLRYSNAIEQFKTEKIFLGLSGVGVATDTAGNNKHFSEVQKLNILDGIAIQDLNTQFDMNNNPQGQDYISRCVAFIDIAMHFDKNKSDNILFYNDGAEYKSATKSVRPKNDKNDSLAWYNCWGFDYLQINTDKRNYNLGDQLSTDKYYYAFHKTSEKEFIYQIYNQNDETFRSCFSFLTVNNKAENDSLGHVSYTINCEPVPYKDKSINFNTAGNIVDLFDLSSNSNTFSYSKQHNLVNCYFNTCFRNYHFSDGISSFRRGSDNNNNNSVGDAQYLPIFAPTKPADACVLVGSIGAVSASFSSIPGQNIVTSDPSQDTTYYEQSDTDKILIRTKTNPTSIANRKYNTYLEYKCKSVAQLAGNYKPYAIKSGGYYFKRLLLNSAVQRDEISIPSSDTTPSSLNLVDDFNAAIDAQAVFTSDLMVGLNEIFFTVKKKNTLNLNMTQDIIDSIFSQSSFINTPDGKGLRIYVGLREVYAPTPKYLANRKGLTATSLNTIRVKDDLISLYKNAYEQEAGSTFNIPVGTKEWGNFFIFDSTTSVFNASETAKKPDGNEITPKRYIYSEAGTTSFRPLPGIVNTPSTNNDSLRKYAHAYIDVPITQIFRNFQYITGNKINVGNFNIGYKPNTKKSQDKGVNFFSAFKGKNNLQQEPYAATIYTFGTSKDTISDKSLYGTINLDSSKQEQAYLTNSDENGKLSELPIFLFSSNSESGKFKGYIKDISLGPSEVHDGVVLKDTTTGLYKKVFWGGCWFPWNSSEQPKITII